MIDAAGNAAAVAKTSCNLYLAVSDNASSDIAIVVTDNTTNIVVAGHVAAVENDILDGSAAQVSEKSHAVCRILNVHARHGVARTVKCAGKACTVVNTDRLPAEVTAYFRQVNVGGKYEIYIVVGVSVADVRRQSPEC